MDNNQNIEDSAIIREIEAGFVLVEMVKSGSCSSCGMSGFCHGQDKAIAHKIKTDQIFEIGDLVKVNLAPGLRVKSSLLVFLFPILAMLFFFSLARYILILSEPLSILISFIGLILSGIAIYFIDKKMADNISFEIVERIEK
ncbi:MAG: SoxR reducing system RseC family protein [Candidatus Cloacimonadales bacterium]|nr:SoxR reducing system RseC family protein [Candidatus Cloacimonadales bacterium]